MKIIDFHNHLMALDLEGELLLQQMDRNNVEKTLIMGITPKYAEYADFVGTNEQVEHLFDKYPQRLIGGFEVNPLNMQESLDALKRYHGLGFKVVKMFPCLGFYPDDETFYPLYEEITEMKMMVLFHMGGARSTVLKGKGPMKISSKYGRPRNIDALAFRFRELVLIMAHMGSPDYEEAVYMAANHPNVYVDCSSTVYRSVFKSLKAREDYLFLPVDFKKMLWGLDGNPEAYASRIKETRELMTELGWQEHIPDVFYDNACRLLREYE